MKSTIEGAGMLSIVLGDTFAARTSLVTLAAGIIGVLGLIAERLA